MFSITSVVQFNELANTPYVRALSWRPDSTVIIHYTEETLVESPQI